MVGGHLEPNCLTGCWGSGGEASQQSWVLSLEGKEVGGPSKKQGIPPLYPLSITGHIHTAWERILLTGKIKDIFKMNGKFPAVF